MAGYAGTRPGWNVSRPGYAWFFGRDACWTIDALLALGAFDEARDAITFLARTMDVTGKVIHEYTTSGVAHFDAADSTPLFLRAVGLYGAWTGDLATIAGWWPAVARAVTFVRSCDRDGDGLPENTGVGHGWIEMGVLGGGAVTSYVAAIWIDALRRLIPMAGHLADEDMARQLTDALRQAEVGLASLRGPDGVLALHRDATGRLSPDRTAMDTVPIALGVGASSSDHALLADLASPRFSAPWGLRMLPVDDPRYDPVAYHAGSAWPLFTGWAALADCAMGAPARGLARVRSMARAAMAGGTGGFAEVLHGDTGARAGVCPDQAWSAAMVISPIVHGFAGLEPDAPHRRAALRLRHPDTNDPLRLQGLRVGETRFDLEWTPTPAGCAVVATHREGPALVLHMDGLAGPGEICDAGHPVHVTVKPDSLVGGEAR
jgi:glycogen debranching enzyme